MIKRIFGCLLIAALLFSLAIVASAETSDNDASLPVSEETEVTEPDTSAEDETSNKVVIVPSAADLPDGYEVDEEFYIEIALTADNGWIANRTWEEIFKEAIDDGGEYIYFIDEEDVPPGYIPQYGMIDTELTDGDIIIIKNVKQGEPPVYELPETGGTGTELYTVVGTALLLAAAAYGWFLHCKRKKDPQ